MGKKEIVKVRVVENYWSLTPVRHHPYFVTTAVMTVSSPGADKKHNHRTLFMPCEQEWKYRGWRIQRLGKREIRFLDAYFYTSVSNDF